MTFIDPAQKLLKHTDRIAAIQAGEKPPPVNVEIDLTNRCNLGCDWCHFGHVHSRGPLKGRRTHDTGDQMDTAFARNLIGQLKDSGVRSVTWTGGGEPTIHPDTIRIAAWNILPQGIYTNGVRCGIDQELAKVLKATMRWVYVSLDRHTRDGYKVLKQVDAFDKAVQGIKNLVAAPGNATIGVGFIVDETSWQDTPHMVRLALDLGADYCQFRPAIIFDALTPSRPIGDLDWIDRFLGIAYFGDYPKGFVVCDRDRFQMYRDWNGHGYPTCRWTQMQTVITPDGRVWTCVNRRGYDGDCIGDLNQETFAEIWARSGPFTVNDHCRVLCRGHLPNLALNKIMAEKGPHDDFI